MTQTLSNSHLRLPPADYSFNGDSVNTGLGVNNPLSTPVLEPLFKLGLFQAVITRRHDFRYSHPRREGGHLFTLLLDGVMAVEYNGIAYDLTPGDLAFCPKGTMAFHSNPGNTWYLYLNFHDHPFWGSLAKRGPYVRPYESADLMYLLMQRIESAYEDRTSLALHFAEGEVRLLTDLLCREVAMVTHRAPKQKASLTRLIERIRQEPEADWTLASMAGEAHLSVRNLTRLFSKEYGISPLNMVVRERMSRSFGLIVQTDMKLTAIAKAVGYESVASFSHLFKRHFGKSPGSCRSAKMNQTGFH
jgi:AraC-like DNA-binding protein